MEPKTPALTPTLSRSGIKDKEEKKSDFLMREFILILKNALADLEGERFPYLKDFKKEIFDIIGQPGETSKVEGVGVIEFKTFNEK